MILSTAYEKFKATMLSLPGPLSGALAVALPTIPVKRIYSADYCEDGCTLAIMVDLDDGSSWVLSVRPGEKITCHQVCTAEENFLGHQES